MGKVLSLDHASDTADWYFSDAYYSSRGGLDHRWQFPWPNSEFPEQVAIHSEDINKIAIRKWIERNDVGTVIHEYVRKSYRVWWSEDPKKRDWDHTSEIVNNWYCFYFEDSESALAFRLRFSDLVKPMTEDHPTKHFGERYYR